MWRKVTIAQIIEIMRKVREDQGTDPFLCGADVSPIDWDELIVDYQVRENRDILIEAIKVSGVEIHANEEVPSGLWPCECSPKFHLK